ncbi:ABC transporter substrate-binding protein [Dactylosporangium sp. CA-233914]|uniref:ABC transporter substrate-binding protein n=1 Tax=Dactylosporangium sp. CA-233914 TaxID=3239934 RepID=UPI003D8D5695
MTRGLHRTIIAAVAFAAVLATGSACSGSKPSTTLDPNEKITLTMTWWGNDTRLANTKKIIDAFQKLHPNITIQPSYSDYSAYWNKLATQIAGNDTPDIMQMDDIYLSTYARQGVLLNLSDYHIDTSLFPKAAVDAGTVDGKPYALPSGAAAYAMVANTALFQQAGIPVPDDTTWTWDDFAKLTKQLTDAGHRQFWGFGSSFGYDDGSLRLWLRQQGETLFSDSGQVAATAPTVAGYFAHLHGLVQNGSTPPASTLQENQGVGLSETFLATNKVAIGSFFNSQLSALTNASKSPLKLLMLPQSKGTYFLKPSAQWAGSARSQHPAAVAAFVDFMVNSTEAGDIQLTERGIPANKAVGAHIAAKLSPVDQAAIDFMNKLPLGQSEPVTPPGGSQVVKILPRYTEQVLFGKMQPDAAAAGFLKELKDAVKNA